MISGKWFLARNKQKLGPFTAAQLQHMAGSRNVQPADMLLQEGSSRWVQAHALSWLFPAQPAPALQVTAIPTPATPAATPTRPEPAASANRPKSLHQYITRARSYLACQPRWVVAAWSGAVLSLILILVFGLFLRPQRGDEPVGTPDNKVAAGGAFVKPRPDLTAASQNDGRSVLKTDPTPKTLLSRTRPQSVKYRVTTRKVYGVSEVNLDLGEVARGSNYNSKAAFVYDYFGTTQPKQIDWKMLELVVSVVSPATLERNPLTGGVWKRGVIGYGSSQFSIVIDGREYSYRAEFDSKESGNFIGESLRMSISQGLAERIYQAKSASIRCGSSEFAVRFELTQDALAGFCDLLDHIAARK